VSRIPRPLARRLDRLAWGAHLFHRYAHHPLCSDYRAELVALGRRTRVCRGCALVLAGVSAGLLAGLVLAPPSLPTLMASLCLGSVSQLRVGHRRPSKWLSRFTPAALLALSAGSGVAARSSLGLGVSLVALGLFALVWWRYRARTPDRTPCQVCPERTLPVPCRGVRTIVRRERAYQRVASRLLSRAGL
jgi:hypothetical protein